MNILENNAIRIEIFTILKMKLFTYLLIYFNLTIM